MKSSGDLASAILIFYFCFNLLWTLLHLPAAARYSHSKDQTIDREITVGFFFALPVLAFQIGLRLLRR